MTSTNGQVSLRLPAVARRVFDIVVVLALVMAAYLARRGSLPFDGLWFDDSWVATGAIHGHVTALMTDGSGTPGFTAILMAVHRFGTGQLRDLGIPSLVAGIAGPALLYIALRRFGYERSIAAVVSAVLVVARIPILYSGRVKGYTFDTLWVIALAIALPPLAARTWRWKLAAAWAVCAVVIGSFSAYTMVAVAGAGFILLLHPASDRIVRVAAVGAQAVAQAAFLAVSVKKSDLAGIEKVLQDKFDAHMNFTLNPIGFAREAARHLRRVAEVFPDSPSRLLTVFALVAIAGLVIAATKGHRAQSVVGRYFLLLMATAFFGSLLHRFPFGPTNSVRVSAGGRHTLWLVPAIAFGLAAVAHWVRSLTTRFDALRLGFDALAVAGAVAIVMIGYTPAPRAPFPGSQSATRYVDASLQHGDVAIVCSSSIFQFADSTIEPVKLVPTPKHQVAFSPVVLDPRIHEIGGWAVEPGGPRKIRLWVRNAKRVFVEATGPLFDPGLTLTGRVLTSLGYSMTSKFFGSVAVEVWRR